VRSASGVLTDGKVEMSPRFLNGFPTARRHGLYRFLRRKRPEQNGLQTDSAASLWFRW
jgi:hypothetical protein